jgi:hypothetical protein
VVAAYKGGRRLQHVLYSAVVRALLGDPVERAEYHFPTRKGENEAIVFHQSRLTRGLELVDELLGLAADGRLLPTEDPSDCLICDFKVICRARPDRYGNLESPPPAWAKEHWEDGAFDRLRALRDWV